MRDSDAEAALRQTLATTRAKGSARILQVRSIDMQTPPALLGRRGPLKWLLRKFLDAARYREAEGVIEFEPLRVAVDQSAFARTEIGVQRWSGRSGRPLSTLPVDDHDQLPALWMWAVLDQVATVAYDGEDEIRGATCRRLAADLDLGDESSATADSLTAWRPPTQESFDTGTPRLQVWLDEQHIRRVRLTTRLGAAAARSDHTLEFWDFGVDCAQFDWSRLSTFRTKHDGEPNRV